jgi:hypothetical protein
VPVQEVLEPEPETDPNRAELNSKSLIVGSHAITGVPVIIPARTVAGPSWPDLTITAFGLAFRM